MLRGQEGKLIFLGPVEPQTPFKKTGENPVQPSLRPHWKRMPCLAPAVCLGDGTTLSLPLASPNAMLSPLMEPEFPLSSNQGKG